MKTIAGIKFVSRTGPPERCNRALARIIAACESVPDGTVIDRQELADIMQTPLSCLRQTPLSHLPENSHLIATKAWFGNKKAIAELKRKFPSPYEKNGNRVGQ